MTNVVLVNWEKGRQETQNETVSIPPTQVPVQNKHSEHAGCLGFAWSRGNLRNKWYIERTLLLWPGKSMDSANLLCFIRC